MTYPPGFSKLISCPAVIMGDFSGLGGGIGLSHVFLIPCFYDISFTTVRWVNVMGSQIGETGSFCKISLDGSSEIRRKPGFLFTWCIGERFAELLGLGVSASATSTGTDPHTSQTNNTVMFVIFR